MNKFSFLALFACSLLFAACAQNTKPAESATTPDATQNTTEAPAAQAATTYYCPMKCEGDKTYAQPGTCPKCGMDLVVAEQGDSDMEESHEGHDHDHDN